MPRPSRLGRWLIVASACLAAGAAVSSARAPAVHAPQLPVGTDGLGVYARVVRGRAVIAFANVGFPIYREIARRRIEVGCTILVQTVGTGYAVSTTESRQSLVPPRRPSTLVIRVGRGRFDFCTITLAGARPVEVAAVPVSRRGATYLDELQTAHNVLSVVSLVGATPPRTPPPAARVARITHGRVVSLRGPDLVPPAGHIGYWTDGRSSIYVAGLTFYGVLFFYQEDIDTGLVITDLTGWMGAGG